jgi:hypothetical protein
VGLSPLGVHLPLGGSQTAVGASVEAPSPDQGGWLKFTLTTEQDARPGASTIFRMNEPAR